MKKVLFFTVFTILGLASCSKSEIEYDNQPQEISLFAVNKVATKAPVREADFPYNMAVAAYLAAGNGVTTGRNYFTTTQFSKNGSYWTGGKYWPISAATLNFLAVAPEETGVVTTSINDDLATSTTIVTNNHNWNTQYDVMYAAVRASKAAGSAPNNPDGNAEQGADVDMVFKHAYALVDFYFTQSNSTPMPEIIINSITVNDVACNGELTLTVNNSTSATESINVVQDWSDYDPNTDIVVPTKPSVVFKLSTTKTRYHEGIMLIPNKAMSSFVINYTIDGQIFDYTYTPNFPLTWTAGTKYTYNITMTPALIQVDPSVDDWGTSESDVTLN